MEPEGYLRFVLALVFVLALIGILAVIARRLGMGFPAHAIKPSGTRRIGVVEVSPLDSRRKLVLIRRDNTEHLIILSPTDETVVERNIVAGTDFKQVLADAESDSSDNTS